MKPIRISLNWVLLPALLFSVFIAYGVATESYFPSKVALVFGCSVLMTYLGIYYRHLLILSLAFLVPMSVPVAFGGTMLSLPSEGLMLLICGVMVLLVFAKDVLNRQIMQHPLTVLLFLQVAWLVIPTLTSEIPAVSAKRWILHTVFVLVYFVLFAHLFSTGHRIKRFYLLYVLGLIIPVLVTLKTHYGYGFSKMSAYLVTGPFFDEHTIYATTLAFIIPFLWIAIFQYKSMGIKYTYLPGLVALLVLMSVALFFSYSRAAWLSVAVMLLFFGFVKMRLSGVTLIIITCVVTTVFALNWANLVEYVQRNEAVSSKGTLSGHIESLGNISTDASNTERINRWSCAWRMFLDKPITGFGPGTYQFKYGPYQLNGEITRISTFIGDKGNAHSDYLMYLSEAGILALLLHLAIIFTTIKTGIRVIYNSMNPKEKWLAYAALLGLVGYFFHGLVNSFLDAEKAMILMYGSMAILVAIDNKQPSEGEGSIVPAIDTDN